VLAASIIRAMRQQAHLKRRQTSTGYMAHNPEESNLHTRRRENLKSHFQSVFYINVTIQVSHEYGQQQMIYTYRVIKKKYTLSKIHFTTTIEYMATCYI
jgi:hypothetical protein